MEFLPSADTIRIGFDSSLQFLEYGKNATTSHFLKGNITASGNISASGEVITNTLRLTPGTNNYVNSTGGSVDIKSANATINLIGNVTASGNIIAQGASSIIQAIDTTSNYVVELKGEGGPKLIGEIPTFLQMLL